jgi:predicted secreted protein
MKRPCSHEQGRSASAAEIRLQPAQDRCIFVSAREIRANELSTCERKFAMQIARSTRRLVSVRWLLLQALAAIACLPQTAFAATTIITGADKGGTVHLKAGDQLTLRLKSNPSTGYMWYVHPHSTPLLKLLHQAQIGPVGPSARQGLGRPGLQVFTFEARHSGDGILLLHYVRSWEKPSPDEEQFQVHVFIQ